MIDCICSAATRLVTRCSVSTRWVGLVATLVIIGVTPAQRKRGSTGDQAPVPKLTREEAELLAEDLDGFHKAETREERSDLFEDVIDAGPVGAQTMLELVEKRLAKVRPKYLRELQRWLKGAYTKRLIGLTDEEIRTVQHARRLWKSYVLHGGHRKNFQAEFLGPMQAAARALLLRADDVKEPALREQRQELVEFGGYRKAVRAALKIDPDPTKGRLSPTKIPYPRLDQPPTFVDSLHHTERTLVLAYTVAPLGAQPVLLFNDDAAQQIDVQEAEFVLFGNEMRILAGTIAWRVDPLGNAVARDHSEDRTKGLAKGHMSSIPEKRGFTHRSRRFGSARFGSEGVGGGRDGRGYIRGLSYGGGHTGPLYSLKRNCVGVGRRGSAYTSIYRTDRRIVHPCQAVAGELALPPGLNRSAVRGTARSVLAHLQAGRFGRAHRLLEKARPANEEAAMLQRFLRAAVSVEVDWVLDSAAAIAAAGDIYEAHRRLVAGRKSFLGISRFEDEAAKRIERLTAPEHEQELRAGKAFHRMALGDSDEQARSRAVRMLKKRFGNTVYAAAAKAMAGKGGPFHYFIGQRPDLEAYEYPPQPNRK